MAHCFTEEQIRDLASGTLTGEQASSLLVHAETCAECRKALAEWRRNVPFLSMLRESFCGHPATLPRSATSPPAEPVEGYDLIEEIHRGAQGIVYRAIDRRTASPVAIKLVGQDPYVSRVSRRRFEREIDLVASLHHPGIIRILDSGTTPSGRRFFVMEYVQGLPLHHFVWQKKLPVADTLKLFIHVCEAVNYAHQRGVIHCDLKPSNILVDGSGTPHILDFGLARPTHANGDTALSITGQIMGTLPYMSPEQTRGDRNEIDIRTDVYSLGVILYEILTGRYPYTVTGSVPEILRNIAEAQPVPPSRAGLPASRDVSVPPSRDAVLTTRRWRGLLGRFRRAKHSGPIDEQVDTIVLKALAKEPHRRYANLAMLIDDLSRHLRGQPIEARREAWLLSFSKQLTRYRKAALLMMALAALSGSLAVINWRTSQNLKAQQVMVLDYQARLANALMQLGDRAFSQSDWEEASGYYRASMFIIRDLVAGDPHNLTHLGAQADVHLRLGNLCKARGESGEAADFYARALETANQVFAADPTRPNYHARLYQVQRLYRSAIAATQTAPATMGGHTPP